MSNRDIELDPNLQQNDNQETSSQQPPDQSQSVPLASSSSGMKVIQPLSDDIKPEPAAQQMPVQPPATLQVAQPPMQPHNTAENMSPPQPTRPDPSSIYPDATRGINGNNTKYPNSAPVNATEDALKTTTFNEGYVVGGTVFFYQLIAGIVLGIVSTFILRTLDTPIASAAAYIIEYLVLLYLPYTVLKSNAVESPLWLTLFGVATQSVVIATGFVLVDLITKAILNHGASVGGSGLAILINLSFLIVSYFLTKLSWGVAFSLVGKIKYKPLIKIIGVGLIAIFIGTIAYHFVKAHDYGVSDQTNTSNSSHQPAGLSSYHVTGNPSFSVNFYEGSKTSGKGDGYLTYSTGHAVQGVSVNVTNATNLNAKSSCSSAEGNSEFNFQSQGSTGIVCVSSNSNVTSYIGSIQVNGKSYDINMFSYSYQTESSDC